ncbi:acetyl-CoA carboxylase carboxyltransferase subunit beta [Holzapfeliella floricola]|uniref:Acetyl-coenzyme A carboxylase carboxyl transferase subunit beta n=1 Tax=Holzapfeliella floricola DSM 23037 = JCM 16512 TaxID=1423744 RepID=A0A0R2DSY7_9LACO|nr:acetyl-CoA carboxylase carboxyl transferase subunit beta [Holzapfeliella floricola DSM 23037 = JCM 16512]
MTQNNLFQSPTPEQLTERMDHIPSNTMMACPYCQTKFFKTQLDEFRQCPECHYGFRLLAHDRIKLLCDSFEETEKDLAPSATDFPDEKYQNKIKQAKANTGLNESVLTGIAKIADQDLALGVMDPYFIMGSLGSQTGEKITRLFELATKKKLPVVLFTASGGARMQERIFSLMQMAKVSRAVSEHKKAGLFYLTVLTDPTTGGVTASFAMQGNITMAEPHALIGFAGQRVIEQTIHQKAPKDFQRAETLMKNGFVDLITPRDKQKEVIAKLLRWHQAK